MRESELRRIDLNLLVVLRVLLDVGSVTRAAERLHMSQPAVSRALAKLRTQLGDKLMVKAAGGMMPTRRAEALSEPLSDLLRQLGNFVEPAAFDPATTRRVFRIAATDYGAIAVLPGLMRAFGERAPLAGIEVLPFSPAVFGLLGSGEVDIVLYSDDPVPGALRSKHLFDETYTCLLRAGHPLLANAATPEGTLTLEAFLACPHGLVSLFGGRRGEVDEALAALGRRRQVSLWLPYFAAAGLVCASSDTIVTLPSRVAAALAAGGHLRCIAPPVDVPGFGYRMLWHERDHDDPGAVWLRALLGASVAGAPHPWPDAETEAERHAPPG